jgi:hypothetical protein
MNAENTDNAPEDANEAVKHIGPIPYMLAAVSFMPILGVITGPISIVWGLSTWKRGGKPVVVIGGAGFLGQSFFFVYLVHGIIS